MSHQDNDRFHKHSDYLQNQKKWETTFDLLMGDHKCLTSTEYLWLHTMEDPQRQCDAVDKKNADRDRALREQRTRYINYPKMVQERFVSLVMKGGIIPDDEVTDLFEDEIDNVDGQERSLEEFTTDVCRDMISYGVGYVFTDSQTVEAQSRAEERELSARPFLQRINPLDLEDWQIGSDGKYEAFRHEYKMLMPRTTLEEEPVLAHFTTIAQVLEGVYELRTFISIDENGHAMNHHPECRRTDQQHHQWREHNQVSITELEMIPLATNRLQESCLDPVIDIALKIYNKQSDLDNILYGQGYDRIFISGEFQGILGDDGEPLSEESKQIRLSANSMNIVPENTKVEKIEPTNPEALIESIRADILDMFRIAFNQARQVRQDSGAVEDASTRREVKEDLLTRIERLREKLLGIMNTSIANYAAFKEGANPDEFEGQIGFAQSVTEVDLQELSSFIKAHSDMLMLYPTAQKEAAKKVISHLNLSKEEEIFEEIENTEVPQPEPEENAASRTRQNLQGLVSTNANTRTETN